MISACARAGLSLLAPAACHRHTIANALCLSVTTFHQLITVPSSKSFSSASSLPQFSTKLFVSWAGLVADHDDSSPLSGWILLAEASGVGKKLVRALASSPPLKLLLKLPLLLPLAVNTGFRACAMPASWVLNLFAALVAFDPDQRRTVFALDMADMVPAAMEAELRRDCARVLHVVAEVPRLLGLEWDTRLGRGWAIGRLSPAGRWCVRRRPGISPCRVSKKIRKQSHERGVWSSGRVLRFSAMCKYDSRTWWWMLLGPTGATLSGSNLVEIIKHSDTPR